MELLLALAEGFFRLPLAGGLPDHVRELGELGPRVPPLLEVEIGAGVEGLDGDVLPPLPGEDDEGDGAPVCPEPLQELDAIHLGHQVVCDDDVVGLETELLKREPRREGGIDGEVAVPAEKEGGELEEGRFVVDIEDCDLRGLGSGPPVQSFWRHRYPGED